MPLILAPPPDQILPNKTISRLVGKMGSSAQKVCNELVKEIKEELALYTPTAEAADKTAEKHREFVKKRKKKDWLLNKQLQRLKRARFAIVLLKLLPTNGASE